MGSRKLRDLEPIHAPGHPQDDPEISRLSDEDLLRALLDPRNGDFVTVKGNRVFDGNTRINEARKRDFNGDMRIPVDELPEDLT